MKRLVGSSCFYGCLRELSGMLGMAEGLYLKTSQLLRCHF